MSNELYSNYYLSVNRMQMLIWLQFMQSRLSFSTRICLLLRDTCITEILYLKMQIKAIITRLFWEYLTLNIVNK